MKKYWFGVYTDAVFVDLLIALYALMAFAISSAIKTPQNMLWWGALFVLIICLLRISWFVCIDAQGIRVYRLFRKRIFLQWEQITHWGTTTKKLFGRIKVNYMFFSSKPLISAPWEKMSPMNEGLIYLTYQGRIIRTLKKIGKTDISKSFVYNSKSTVSDDMSRRLTLSVFAMLLVFIVVLLYFIVIQPIVIPFLVLAFSHVLFISLSTVEWADT